MFRASNIVLGILLLLGSWGCAARIPLLSGSGSREAEQRQREAMQYFLKAKVFEAKKDHHGAIVALRNAADLDPTSATIFAQLARNYEAIQDDRMALNFAERALDIDPERADLRRMLLRVYRRTGQKTEAAKEIEKLLEMEPANWRLYFRLVHLYLETNQGKKIEPLFDRALKRVDTPSDVRVNIAYVLSRSGNHKKAERVFREVVRAHPDVGKRVVGLGGASDRAWTKGRRSSAVPKGRPSFTGKQRVLSRIGAAYRGRF